MQEAKIRKTSFYKNPFVGIYAKASDNLVLLPKNSSQKFIEDTREALNVETVKLFVNQSPIIGVFAALNSNGCVLPSFAEREEKEILKKAGLNVCTISESFVPGNNILANDRAALINPKMGKNEERKIADGLNIEIFRHPLAGQKTVGAMNVATNRGFLAYNEMSETEVKMLEGIFKVKGSIGTANLGSVATSFSIVANSNGALVGELTSGFEIQRIYEALFG